MKALIILLYWSLACTAQRMYAENDDLEIDIIQELQSPSKAQHKIEPF